MRIFLFILLFWLIIQPIVGQSGEWTSYKHMPTRRQELPAGLLNGKIYVPGGIVLASTNKMEVYDPETDSWSLAAPMPDSRHHHMMAVVDGKLIVVGGHKNVLDFDAMDNVWQYDPDSNAWTWLTPIPLPVGSGAAVTYNDKVYVMGGTNDSSVLDINYRYDPLMDSWEKLAGMPTPREHLAAAVIDTLIYVVGGRGSWGAGISLEAYSPSTNTWEVLSTMPTDRSGLAAAELNGKLFAFGGEGGGIHDETEEYDPATDSWRSMQPMTTPRHGIDAVKLGDEIFIPGGAWIEGYGPSNKMESFRLDDLATGSTLHSSIREHYGFTRADRTILLSFHLEETSTVYADIFDMNGSLMSKHPVVSLGVGEHALQFNGKTWAAGIYHYVLRTDKGIVSGTISLQ